MWHTAQNVQYRGELYVGEQQAIVPQELFDQTRQLLQQNRRCQPCGGQSPLRGLLQGLRADRSIS